MQVVVFFKWNQALIRNSSKKGEFLKVVQKILITWCHVGAEVLRVGRGGGGWEFYMEEEESRA